MKYPHIWGEDQNQEETKGGDMTSPLNYIHKQKLNV